MKENPLLPAPRAKPTVEVAHDSGFPFIDNAVIAARLAEGWKIATSFATVTGHVFIYYVKQKGGRGK